MADYNCPRCGENSVSRNAGGRVAGQFGLVGALIGAAMAGFECRKCGPIQKDEFPSHVRSEMGRNSMLMVVGGVVVFGVLIAVLIALA